MRFQTGNGPILQLLEHSAFDIGSCVVDGVDLAPGKAVPDDGDPRILEAVGGFLFTCGPDHIRHPEPLEGGGGRLYPLHGSMSGTPVDLQSSAPGHDHDSSETAALIHLGLARGDRAMVQRRWRMDSATGEVVLEDHLTNTGDRPFAPMLMYHINIGAHLLDEKTRLTGSMFDADGLPWTFGEGDGHVFCVPAEPEEGDEFARVVLGPIAMIGGKSLHVRFSTDTIPYLQMWRNQVAPAHVLGIEPVSHPWNKRAELAELGLMTPLEPGDFKIYRLSFCFR